MARTTYLSAVIFLGAAAARAAAPETTAVDGLLERITRQEQAMVERLRQKSAVLETYIQELGDVASDDEISVRDHYFLGRLDLSGGPNYVPLVARSEPGRGSRPGFLKAHASVFVPNGFAQMVLPDRESFNRQTYRFDYVRREFLGDVRCLIFDVSPFDKKTVGKFIGRIWVEDRDYHVVRFNGTYTHSTPARLYFHFDSWRVNVSPGEWVPAFIYVEESQPLEKGRKFPRFKAQSRLWGYNAGHAAKLGELASIAIEAEQQVKDTGMAAESTPLESQRSWERQAEANIIERLEKSGLLAQPGAVDDVLNTVVNNLIVSSKLGVEARCRVLLTTPLETISVGQTIVISRGLLDVLPDEASLAMVLAGELAHIALGHRNETQFAFFDRTMLPDEEMLNRLRLSRPPGQIATAAVRASSILAESPYQDKMGNAGLFLRALAARAPQLPNLIRANLGNQLASGDGAVRMQALASKAPALEDKKLDQIAALPLGSRIRLDPWANEVALLKTRPVSLLSPRDKLPFEITPFMIPLSRVDTRAEQIPAARAPVQPSR